MKLRIAETQVLKRILEILAMDPVGGQRPQQEIAKEIGVGVSTLSKAKNGFHIGQQDYRSLIEGIGRLAAHADADGAGENSHRIDGLVKDLAALHKEQESFLPESLELNGMSEADFRGEREGLKDGFASLKANCTLNPELWGGIDLTQLWILAARYEVPGTDKLLEAISTTVKELNAHSKPRRTIAEAVQHDDFRSVLSWSRAQSLPMLCASPFFLTADRRWSWGTIRYGSQIKIGVVLSQALTQLLNWDDRELKSADFCQLIGEDVAIHGVLPFSAEQIICQMLLQSGRKEIVTRFNRRVIPAKNDFELAVRSLLEFQPGESFSKNILVFDLGKRTEVEHHLSTLKGDRYFEIRELSHGIDIPVGIGYSLPAFPWVSKKDNYRILRARALEALRGYKDDFAKAGMRLDDL